MVSAMLPFNSPWECRIGLTDYGKYLLPRKIFNFQFPVGMSNRSYFIAFTRKRRPVSLAFNSPWECRIGLTGDKYYYGDDFALAFQFPVGMSNRSYGG